MLERVEVHLAALFIAVDAVDRFYLLCENGAGFFRQTVWERLKQRTLERSKRRTTAQNLE